MSDLASPRSPGSGDLAHEEYDYDDDNDADFEDSRDYEDRESEEGKYRQPHFSCCRLQCCVVFV